MNKFDKVVGCIIGGAIGDAMGFPFESTINPSKTREGNRWHVSDDTQLTLATCEAIILNDGIVDPATIADKFASWHRNSRVTGMGASTFKALSELVRGGHWALVGRKGEHAAGNGAAMRIAPLAFCMEPSNASARQLIRDVSRITHHNEEAYVGALAASVAVRAAWDGTWSGEANLLQHVANSLPDSKVRDQVVKVSELKAADIGEIAGQFGNSGYVIESIPLAIVGAERVSELGFEGMMRKLIEAGGDADTIASIAGQVAGTFLGRSNLPSNLMGRLPEINTIESIAQRFAYIVTAARA